MDKTILENAKSFIYKNGRLIDRRRYEYFFEDGTQERVISALAPYQNEDGGFGNALEPDIRCPQSQPVATEVALMIMDEIEWFSLDILKGIVRYLEKITVNTGGFPLALRELNEYPHAPWWTVKEDHTANINPTGRIIGLLLKQNIYTDFYQEEWFQKTLQYIWNYFESEMPSGYHDGVQWISFLEHASERSRAQEILTTKMDKWLGRPGIIELDPTAQGYVHKVLEWAPTRESYAMKFISEEELQAHLSHLIAQQQEDGGWLINFPETSQGAGLEWRSWLTVEQLKTLKSYGL